MNEREIEQQLQQLSNGDEITITWSGVVDIVNDNNERVAVLGPWRGYRLNIASLLKQGAKIEVTRAVDHPCHDPVGAVRGDGLTDIWIKTSLATLENDDDDTDVGYLWWNIVTGEEGFDENVVNHPLLGVVPGVSPEVRYTTAAERRDRRSR